MIAAGKLVSNVLFLGMVAGIPSYGFLKGVKVYETFVEGAKEGFQVSIRIIPYMIGMLVAIGMFRASGGIEWISTTLSPVMQMIGMPSELLPLALMRPFSGSGSNAILAELITHHGGDAFISLTAATMMGSTETTFFVATVYFGSVNVSQTRHAIPAGLIADFTGIVAAVVVCRLLFL